MSSVNAMRTEVTENNTYAINPFVVAEVVVGERINWPSSESCEHILSLLLNMPIEEIFDSQSPILIPSVAFHQDGTAKKLKRQFAIERLVTFVEKKQQFCLVEALEIDEFLIKPTKKRILDALMSCVEAIYTPMQWSAIEPVLSESRVLHRISLCNGYFFAALASVGWSRSGDTKQLIYQSTNEDWWTTLLNKAYDLWNTGITSGSSDSADACDGGGNPALICQRLVGDNIVYKHHNETSVGELTGFIRGNCRGEFSINPMVAWTHRVAPKDCEYIAKRVVPSHAYSVLGLAYANGENYVVLRNPWGMYEAITDTLTGCWCPYQYSHLRVHLNRNGVFAMRISNFKKYFCGCAAVNQGCI